MGGRAGLLQKIKAEMITKGTPSPFDILYVVDSERSWYTHEDGAEFRDAGNAADVAEADGLGNYYKKELEIAVRPYRDVIMLGDSMGASAALMFCTLATSVIAFCPQVCFPWSLRICYSNYELLRNEGVQEGVKREGHDMSCERIWKVYFLLAIWFSIALVCTESFLCHRALSKSKYNLAKFYLCDIEDFSGCQVCASPRDAEPSYLYEIVG